MRDALRFVRGLALVGVVLAAVALPLGAFLWFQSMSPSGDGGFGDLILQILGFFLIVFGVVGLVFGGLLAVIAKRAMASPVEVVGTRRAAFAASLTIVVTQVAVGAAIGMTIVTGLTGAYAAGYLVVAASSRGGRLVLAALVSVAFLGLGFAVLGLQIVQLLRPAGVA